MEDYNNIVSHINLLERKIRRQKIFISTLTVILLIAFIILESLGIYILNLQKTYDEDYISLRSSEIWPISNIGSDHYIISQSHHLPDSVVLRTDGGFSFRNYNGRLEISDLNPFSIETNKWDSKRNFMAFMDFFEDCEFCIIDHYNGTIRFGFCQSEFQSPFVPSVLLDNGNKGTIFFMVGRDGIPRYEFLEQERNILAGEKIRGFGY